MNPIIIILSVCFMGSLALVPLMYLAVVGDISLSFLITATILGNFITDVFWMWLARRLGQHRIEKLWIVRENPQHLIKAEQSVKKHGTKMLFLSKFIQGTGIATQFAAGIFKIPWGKALTANLSGSIVWTGLVYLLAKKASSLSILEENISIIKWGFLIAFAAVVLFHLFYYFKNGNTKSNGNI